MDSGNVAFSIRELFRLGGITMWPLLAYSIAVVYITVERFISFMYYKKDMDDISANVSKHLADKNIADAEHYLNGLNKRFIGKKILLALIKHAKREGGRAFSELRAERDVQTEAAGSISVLESGLNFLIIMGSLSPLTGFLGTVTGMISAFRSIAEATEVNAQIVANGIYEALITTVFGLVVAIIAMISHSIYIYFVDKFSSDVEKNCSQLIAVIVDSQEIDAKK